MDANIRGLVDRLDLAPSRGIMPLFEAISNAIDAIEETKRGYSNSKITVRLIASYDLVQQAGDEFRPGQQMKVIPHIFRNDDLAFTG